MNAMLSPFQHCWALICLFVWPARFVDDATRDSVVREFETNKQLRQNFPDRKLPDDRIAEFRRGRQEQTQSLRRSILSSFTIVVSLCLAAWATSAVLQELPAKWSGGLRVLSAGLILWAVFGRLGWSIQTWDGATLPERVSNTWFRITYALGIYFLVLSLLLRAGNRQ